MDNAWRVLEVLRVGDNLQVHHSAGEEFGRRPTGREPRTRWLCEAPDESDSSIPARFTPVNQIDCPASLAMLDETSFIRTLGRCLRVMPTDARKCAVRRQARALAGTEPPTSAEWSTWVLNSHILSQYLNSYFFCHPLLYLLFDYIMSKGG